MIYKSVKTVNVELGNEMWKMNYLTWHERGTKKYLSPRQESNPWSPKHMAGAPSTELRELKESKLFL